MSPLIISLAPKAKTLKNIFALLEREELEWMLAAVILGAEHAKEDEFITESLDAAGYPIPEDVVKTIRELGAEFKAANAAPAS